LGNSAAQINNLQQLQAILEGLLGFPAMTSRSAAPVVLAPSSSLNPSAGTVATTLPNTQGLLQQSQPCRFSTVGDQTVVQAATQLTESGVCQTVASADNSNLKGVSFLPASSSSAADVPAQEYSPLAAVLLQHCAGYDASLSEGARQQSSVASVAVAGFDQAQLLAYIHQLQQQRIDRVSTVNNLYAQPYLQQKQQQQQQKCPVSEPLTNGAVISPTPILGPVISDAASFPQ
jgi:hypothetical protein